MSIAKQHTYNAEDFLPLTMKEDIAAFRFTSHMGSICGDGLLAAGITEIDQAKDELASIIVGGTALLTLKQSVAQGDQIASDSSGYGVKATTGDFVNAIALGAGVTNANIEVHLVNYKI